MLYICIIMKKVLFIALAVILVAGCGQRRAAKSQESQKESCAAEASEVVEHKCCGHHGAEGCPAEVSGKECGHADAKSDCNHAEKVLDKVEEVCDQIEKAADNVEEAAEQAEPKGATVVQLGKKADPKPIKPVPIPKK